MHFIRKEKKKLFVNSDGSLRYPCIFDEGELIELKFSCGLQHNGKTLYGSEHGIGIVTKISLKTNLLTVYWQTLQTMTNHKLTNAYLIFKKITEQNSR